MPLPTGPLPALARAIADPPRVPDVQESSALDGLARRTVRPLDLLGHSVAVVAPSASALTMPFVLMWVVGPGAWLSAVIGFGLAFLLSSVFTQFATRIAAPGSLSTWVTRGIGPAAGLVVAALLLLGYATLVAFGVSQTVRRGTESLTGSGLADPDPGTQVLFAVAAIGVCLWISVRGVAVSTRVALVAESFLVVSLVVLVLVTLVREHDAIGIDLSLAGADPVRIIFGAGLIMGITVGFESSASLAAETERPFLTLPRVFGGTVAISAALYALAYVAADATVATTGREGGPAQRWFPGDVDMHHADALLSALLSIGFLTLALCALNALARLVFSLAREGLLPSWLGRTHPRWHSPSGALLVITPVAVAPAAVSALCGTDVGSLTSWLIGAVVVVMAVAYAVVAVAVPLFLARLDEWTWRPVVVALGTAALLLTVCTTYVLERRDDGTSLSLALVAGALVAGLGWYAVVRRSRPATLARMGVHDETIASDLLSR